MRSSRLGSIFFGVNEPTEVAPGVTWGVVTPDIASVTVTTPDGETFEGRMMDLPDGEVAYDAYVVELRSQANGVFSIEARDATGRVVVSGGIRALDNAARPRRSLGKQAPRDVGFRNA